MQTCLEPEQLLDRVEPRLAAHQPGGSAHRPTREVFARVGPVVKLQALAGPGVTDVPVDEKQPREAVIVDWPAALINVNGDQELLIEVVQLFHTDSSRMLNLVREAVGDGDADALARSAHLLKGAMLFLGDTQASSVAQHLEHIGAAGDLSDARRALTDLGGQLKLLRNELAVYLEKVSN